MNVDGNTIALVLVALLNCVTAYMAWRTKVASELTEKNTNSMKDALVASTGKASLAQGRAEGRASAKAEAEAENIKKP